jgi:hypothetical protein
MAEQTQLYDPSTVRNMDVVGIAERIDRTMYEIATSESSTLNSLEQYDLERIEMYNAALRTYASFINSSVMMDLPHSTPTQFTIKFLTQGLDLDSTKNRVLRDLLRLYSSALLQWTRSESADKSNGWYPFDYDRFLLIMDRIDGYLSQYVESALPLDLPESSAFEDSQL